MKIAFRVDASTLIGTGHIMRCAVLAKYLQGLGAEVCFFCRQMPGDLCRYLEDLNLPVHRLLTRGDESNWDSRHYETWLGVELGQEISESHSALKKFGPFDWVVVDHYSLDYKWHSTICNVTRRIFVIDDLAHRRHDCDVLLNHAYLPNLGHRYKSLVNDDTTLLLGPDYFILDPVFGKMRNKGLLRDGNIRRMFIFYGGVDATNETDKAVDAIAEFATHDIQADVVITSRYPYKTKLVKKVARFSNVSLHVDQPNLAGVIARSSIGFGAGGGTTYERMFLGLPSIVTTTAENQVASIRYMSKNDLVWWVGNSEDVSSHDLSMILSEAMDNPSKLCRQSEALLTLLDGKGLSRLATVFGS